MPAILNPLKWYRAVKILVSLVLLLIIGVVVLYFYRNSLIRSAVESQANSSLGVKTTLRSADLGLFGGTLDLGDLRIGSPNGYHADQMFTLNQLGLGVNYGDLRKEPIRVKRIIIDRPKAVLEYQGGKFNFQALMDQMGNQHPKTDQGKEPVKLIIDELTVKDAQVAVRAPMLPSEVSLTIPTVTLNNVGTGEGNQDGAAIRDVVGATMSALAAKAANSPQLVNFKELQNQLAAQAQQVAARVSKQLSDQVNSITKDLGNDLSKIAPGVDVNKTLQDVTGGKDPGKAIDKGIGNLLGGKKEEKEKKK
jgi:uncharacterized protein involved in outer membrane biogenesis